MKSSQNYFITFVKDLTLTSKFVDLFIKVYVFLLGLGVFEYSIGYDYFNYLSTTQANHSYIQALRILIYLTCFLFVLGIAPIFNLIILTTAFCIYEYFWGADLMVYTTNVAAPVLVGTLAYIILKKRVPHLGFVFCNYVLSILGFAYLTSAFSKIFSHNSGWLTGEALRAYFYESSIFQEHPLKTHLLNSPFLPQAFSYLIILWEICFVLSLFSNKKIKIFFLVSGLFFHLAIYYFLGPNFFYFFVPCYLAFIPFLFQQRQLNENF